MDNVKVTSSLFYDSFTGSGGGGVTYYPGNILDRITHVSYFEVAWNLVSAQLVFTASGNTITLTNRLDYRTFKTQGFKTNDLIDIVDTDANDGSYTILTISDDGKTITTNGTLSNETCQKASIHGTTPITALDFYYNLVKNDSQEDYFSLTDSQTKQKFTVSGLDATDTTPINFTIGTKSYGWVVNAVTNGTTSEVTIRGEGISGYKQKFRITQLINYTAPIYLAGQYNNLADELQPGLFPLKYICKLNAKYTANSPVTDHTGGINPTDGYNAWLNEGKSGARAQYYIHSIVYSNDDDASLMERLDVNKDVLVTITLKNFNDSFVNGGIGMGTRFVLGFNTCPSSETDYQNTEATLTQNFFIDSAVNYLGDSPVNGLNYGTSRQSITQVEGVYDDVNQAIITFVFSAGSLLQSYWEGKADDDRKYLITIITQDVSITTTEQSDRVTAYLDFPSADWDKTDDSLSSFTRTGIEAFKFPDQDDFAQGNISGVEGEKWLATLPFRVSKVADGENTPTLKDFTFQILAQKTGLTDFVLEQKIIITSGYRKLLGVQDIDFEDTRGFIGPVDDLYNSVFIVRDPDNDTVDEAAYLANYGLALRYEHWTNALDQFQVLSGVQVSPITKYIQDINQRWSNYNNVEGWNLVFKMSWNVTGTDGFDNNFYTQIPIEVIESETADWPSSTGDLTIEKEYFAWDEVNEVVGEDVRMIIYDGNKTTLVRFTYTGNYALDLTATGWHGTLFANFAGGSIYDRRLASTHLDSETDSPWTATPENLDATYSFASANARINIFLDSGDPSIVEKIEVESLFNSSLYDQLVEDVEVYSNLGLLYAANSSS